MGKRKGLSSSLFSFWFCAGRQSFSLEKFPDFPETIQKHHSSQDNNACKIFPQIYQGGPPEKYAFTPLNIVAQW
jgi:hypothetical protein